jgi:hypothetical protein
MWHPSLRSSPVPRRRRPHDQNRRLLPAIYFGLKTFAEKETVDQYCDSDSCSDPRGLAAEQRAYDAATLSTVSFSVGLAASGVLVYLLLTQSNDSEPSRRVEVFPTFGESSVGVSSALRF